METIRCSTTVAKTFTIECAHRLPNVPDGHKCGRLHGHSIKIEIAVTGPVLPGLDWVVDYADIKAAWQPIHDRLDHNYLNDVPGLENSTSENLARWIFIDISRRLVNVSHVTVHETCTARVIYTSERVP